jgi:hypothetical protein
MVVGNLAAMSVGACCRLGGALAAALVTASWIGLGAAGAWGFSLEIGQNFTAATVSTSGDYPPDVMGSVGPGHVAQLINGEYRVYRKSDGTLLDQRSLYGFWEDAGIAWPGPFDPRIIYDPLSQRWFASSADWNGDYLVAVSESSDPTEGWTGFAIVSDPTGNTWVDFPTLGVDADGVYMAGTQWSFAGEIIAGRTVVVLPKADLLALTPSIAGATLFELSFAQLAFSPQLVVNLDGGGLPMPIIASTGIPAWVQFARIDAPVTSPSLSGIDGTGIVTLPFVASAVPAEQPGPAQNLETDAGDSGFHSNFVLQNGALWGARAVSVSGRASVQWIQIDPDTNTILQTGLITDDELDLFYPSIAVNEFDQVVIGLNGSSESQFASAYAVLGETNDGVTSFGDLMLLKEGVDSYEFVWDGRNRWGDYSTTVVDPSDPSVFWTFQEWADFGGSNWATQITQLRVIPDTTAVEIDIKPGSDPNSINPFSRGVIPVAILTTEDFDALTVDPDSVLFGPAKAEKVHKKAHVEDVDGDGGLDLLLQLRTRDTGIALGDAEACLTGQTYDGVPIRGCDSVRTVPPN